MASPQTNARALGFRQKLAGILGVRATDVTGDMIEEILGVDGTYQGYGTDVRVLCLLSGLTEAGSLTMAEILDFMHCTEGQLERLKRRALRTLERKVQITLIRAVLLAAREALGADATLGEAVENVSKINLPLRDS